MTFLRLRETGINGVERLLFPRQQRKAFRVDAIDVVAMRSQLSGFDRSTERVTASLLYHLFRR